MKRNGQPETIAINELRICGTGFEFICIASRQRPGLVPTPIGKGLETLICWDQQRNPSDLVDAVSRAIYVRSTHQDGSFAS